MNLLITDSYEEVIFGIFIRDKHFVIFHYMHITTVMFRNLDTYRRTNQRNDQYIQRHVHLCAHIHQATVGESNMMSN